MVNVIGLKSSVEVKDGRYGHEPGLAVLISIHALSLQGDSCNDLIVKAGYVQRDGQMIHHSQSYQLDDAHDLGAQVKRS